MKMLLSFVLLFMHSAQAQAYMSSIILSDAKSENVLGTASHICFSLYQETPYFVTAAHVVEGVDNLVGRIDLNRPSVKLKKYKVDSAIDLAVLIPDTKQEVAMGLMLPCHSAPLFGDPIPHLAFDVLASTDTSVYRLDIEGYDSDLKQLRTETVIAPVIKSIQQGIPGRESVGQVYMSAFKAKPGFSGGIVTAYLNQNSRLLEPHTENTDYTWGLRRQFLGLVVSAEQVRGRVAIIPASQIMQWFLGMGSVKSGIENSITTLNGIVNKELKIFINTPVDTMTAVGLLSFGGVGTGRPAVGSPAAAEERAGIILQEQKDKRWLSIEDIWIEGEPLSSKAKSILKQDRQNIKGIYIDSKGRLQKTRETLFPKILQIDELNKALKQTDKDCAQIKFKNIDTKQIMNADLCESFRRASAEYKISSELIVTEILLQDSDDNQLNMQAKINNQPAFATSLRRLKNQRFNIKIEGLSGIEIQDKQTGHTWIGPLK